MTDKPIKCKNCGYQEMAEEKETGKYVYDKTIKVTLMLEDLPVYICPECGHKYYSKKYELARTKQVKTKLAPLIGYKKYLYKEDLIEIRNKLQKTSDEMCVLIGCRFGQYKRWEKGDEKIPAAYNIILKAILDDLNGNNKSMLELLQNERNWWKS